MSVDVSPDGRTLVFDLLAHVYRVPVEGGAAECLTADSGVALNYHPRYSPDGRSIAFISDRNGQNHVWIMDADGGNPRRVLDEEMVRATAPVWTPDGEYLIVERQLLGTPRASGLFLYHRNGGEGVELVGKDVRRASWPSVSPDGRYLDFQFSPGSESDLLRGAFQIDRLDRLTGERSEITAGEAQQQYQGSSGGAIAPEPSPDGRFLAFARRMPGATISYKGHKYGPRTALWLRDLETGAERLLLDPIEMDLAEGMKTLSVLPLYSWSEDARSIYLSRAAESSRGSTWRRAPSLPSPSPRWCAGPCPRWLTGNEASPRKPFRCGSRTGPRFRRTEERSSSKPRESSGSWSFRTERRGA